MVGKPLAEIKVIFVERLPIKDNNSDEINKIGALAESLIECSRSLLELNQRFADLMRVELSLSNITRSLTRWYLLAFKEFIFEIEKAQKLTLQKKSEWMQHFEVEKGKALALKADIDRLDHEIDQIVYKLYRLTPEEIKMVEGSMQDTTSIR